MGSPLPGTACSMESQEQQFGKEQGYALERLINPRGAAEGSTLPPRQRGRSRVPRVTNLTNPRTQTWMGGTQFTLIWDEPEVSRNAISHFNIYVINLLDANEAPLGPWTAARSPAEIYIPIRQQTPCTLIVQTVLKNGLVSNLNDSPAISGYLGTGGLVTTDFEDETVPLSALVSGTANYLLTAAGAGVASAWKSITSHDLVLGQSNLTTATRLISVSAAKTIQEHSALTFHDNTLDIQAALALKITTVTGANHSAGAETVILVDATSNNITITLPAISGVYANTTYWIKRIDNVGAYSVTVNTPGAETIDGQADLGIVGQYTSYTLSNDGSNWFII